MTNLLKTLSITAAIAGMLLTYSIADAGNRGKGQMLRDGSCAGTCSQFQGKGQRGDCQVTDTCPNVGTGRYGDGTRPRPQDGTGFGARR
ncbi:MAG TPA: hypothetical protein HPP56_05105 [Nitrospirae bacterium]|nr:hypothetical protein [Nitrospirota bacterium]